ncbi:MAG: hypothetical protein CSA22_06555 [Deltaproteobacteria bacterium]|nr:MAG: hypothetical protein CSA22_06555 [Deltaproteobacteria bacterium]
MRVEMQIATITLDPDSKTPILVLKSIIGDRTLPIWVGLPEAASIISALQDVTFERPMTHDLFCTFIDQVKKELTRIEVCDLKGNTFYARIFFKDENTEFSLDARPSDAIALAVRLKARIYAAEHVLNMSETEVKTPEGEIEDDSEEGKKWAEYLAGLSPDDFGKYKV